MQKVGWFGGLRVTQGNQQHKHSIERIRLINYWILIETMHLSCTIFELQPVIC